MTTPIANFAGLNSGVQWNEVVDSIIAADEARLVTPVANQREAGTAAREAWKKLEGLVNTLNDVSRSLRQDGFGGFLTTVPDSPVSGRTLFSASASTLASAGRYGVEVVQLAETAKAGGRTFASRTDALGLAGDFTVGGALITVEATDSLQAIRDRINAANTGATPSGVIATIVNEGAGGRLVLTRSESGSTGLGIEDGTGGLARELGFLDSRSRTISSTTEAIATALGIAVSPPPASIRVDGRTITVDLATESIAAVVAKINAAGGQASAEEIRFGDETRFQLAVNGNVTADPADPNSQAVIDALGMRAGEAGSVRQVVATDVFTDAGGGVVTTATALAGLRLGGNDLGLAEGDAINVTGTRGDGSTVTIGIAIDPGETLQDLLDRLNDATSGFGAGTRTATASLGSDGRIRLADAAGGPSRLAFSMEIVRADGSRQTTAAPTVETAGRNRELQAGRDAIIRVDGAEFVRSSNTITDAITNVTLNLVGAEAGTTLDVSIERDVDGATAKVKEFADAYNAIRTFFDEQRALDAPLYGDTLLRAEIDGFRVALRTEVAGNATYSRATLAGLTLDRFGKLTFNESTFKEALGDAPAEIASLFGFSGIGGAFVTATDRATAFGSGTISTAVLNIDETSERLRLREEDARRRLDARRQQLVLQFTRMEEALSRLQGQSSALASLTASLSPANRR